MKRGRSRPSDANVQAATFPPLLMESLANSGRLGFNVKAAEPSSVTCRRLRGHRRPLLLNHHSFLPQRSASHDFRAPVSLLDPKSDLSFLVHYLLLCLLKAIPAIRFSIPYPPATLRCPINQITVTHLDIQLSVCMFAFVCAGS